MNVGRAKEIVESADMIHVTFDGIPVMIQHVDDRAQTARIFLREKPEVERDVPVASLIEKI